MRSWVWGGCLAAVTAGGVYFVFSGAETESHCGPCLAQATAAPPSQSAPPVPVTEVVNVEKALAHREPKQLPFVSFDEPPLAKPKAKVPDVIPAAFDEPATAPQFPNLVFTYSYPVEVAPMPRAVALPAPAKIPLASPNDPF